MTLLNQDRESLQYGPYSIPRPYPLVKVEGPNHYYARILLENIAGKISETSAINQFNYHRMSLENRELGELLRGIGLVEMHHLELLGRTVTALGGDPRWHGYDGRYWGGDLVYYGTDVVDRLTADIALEKQAIEQYRSHLDLIADPHVRKLLERIVKDEQYHVILLQSMLKKYIGK